MSKRLVALNLVLALTALVFAVQLGRFLAARHPLPAPPAVPAPPSVPIPTATVPQRPPLSAYTVIPAKNLFSPTRSEGTTASASINPANRPWLSGIVINGPTRIAYLEDQLTKRTLGYRLGDPVAGGVLETIEPDRVVIKRPEGPVEVMLKDSSKPRVLVAASPGSSGAVPSPPALPYPLPATPPTLGVRPPAAPVPSQPANPGDPDE